MSEVMMPRKRDTLCAGGCVKLLSSSKTSLPPGERTCHKCRRQQSRPYGIRVVRGTRPCEVCDKDTTNQRFCSWGCRQANDDAVRSQSKRFWSSKQDRIVVAEQYDWRCHLCDELIDPNASPNSGWDLTLDHIVPRSHGGSDDLGNLAAAHRRCNTVRGTRSIDDARKLLVGSVAMLTDIGLYEQPLLCVQEDRTIVVVPDARRSWAVLAHGLDGRAIWVVKPKWLEQVA